MENLKFKKLTEFELWIEDHVIDDIGYPIKSQNYLGDF